MAHFFYWQQKGLKAEKMRLSPELTEQLRAIVEDEGLELLATEVHGSGSKMILRLVVDGVRGVSLEKCASISHQSSALLDVEDPFSHHYTLEVSSPGLDRKFYSEKDYETYAGHRVLIKMAPAYRPVRRCSGKLETLKDGIVYICSDDENRLELPLDQILETRLEIDWKRVMKEGKTNR